MIHFTSSPLAAKTVFTGRSSDLSLFAAPSPALQSGILPANPLAGLTAAGTVADSLLPLWQQATAFPFNSWSHIEMHPKKKPMNIQK